MKLGDLVDRVGARTALEGAATLPSALRDSRVAGLAYDSRAVVPGTLFFALRGQHADGAGFAAQAASRGATAVVAESAAPPGWPGPWLVARDARQALAFAASTFYRHPSEELLVIGVTGTNGKTTTTHLLRGILETAGLECGIIGTIGYRIGDSERPASRTTPESPDVQRLLREMADARCAACAMEVSSHALAQSRVDDVRFSGAVFTNLTRDHLDFHGSMERYFLAKRRLFEMQPPGAPIVVNADDPSGVRLAAEFPRAVTYGVERSADIAVTALSLSLSGISMEVRTPRGALRLESPMAGRPNAYNILAAAAVATAIDLPFAAIEVGVGSIRGVPGRFQTVTGPDDDVTVIVDYAHTDDALRNLLETARPLARGRLVTVFGCGGDRDRTKRPLMGAVAARLSDLVVLTSDNPRSEDPLRIIEEIKSGLVQSDRLSRPPGRTPAPAAPWLAIVDRRDAIVRAVTEANPGDLVIIAGKGHETTQVIGDRTVPFDDADVARQALARRREHVAARTRGDA
jgi:UDP-N-acetylmuramoyl-L-alanyl-D-glutamate--2,6-diaminopimelate ligase